MIVGILVFCYTQGTYVEGIKEEVVLSPGHALSFIAAGEGIYMKDQCFVEKILIMCVFFKLYILKNGLMVKILDMFIFTFSLGI